MILLFGWSNTGIWTVLILWDIPNSAGVSSEQEGWKGWFPEIPSNLISPKIFQDSLAGTQKEELLLQYISRNNSPHWCQQWFQQTVHWLWTKPNQIPADWLHKTMIFPLSYPSAHSGESSPLFPGLALTGKHWLNRKGACTTQTKKHLRGWH